MGSARFLLANDDWKKVGTGLWIALAGAVLAWGAAELIPSMQQSANPRVLLAAAVLSALVNALRKWLTDTRPK
jgi:hypothetical protein